MTDQEREAIAAMQNAKTLREFEDERLSYSYFPPDQSDSFWYIGENDESAGIKAGYIDLYTMDRTFILELLEGTLFTGVGEFKFDNNPYIKGIIYSGSKLVIDEKVILDDATLEVYGDIELAEGAELELVNGSDIHFHRTSTFIINKNASITIEELSNISTYGTMEVDVDLMDDVMYKENFWIDPSVVIKPINMDLGDREYSFTDYDAELREDKITPYTQGDKVIEHGRLRYVWQDGSYDTGAQIIKLVGSYGNVALGDFKLSVLGKQAETIAGLQVVRELVVEKNMTIHIDDSYNGDTYLYPELYIGAIPDNNKESGIVNVEGTIVVNGETSKITLDRLGKLVIKEGGLVILKNDGTMVSRNNSDNTVLHIDGTLIVDSEFQLVDFISSNIEFGENGKIIILNPSTEDKVLFETPEGIYYTYLYQILLDHIDHVEYHLSPNTGIRIDHNYDYPAIEFTDWFGGRRIEKAIHDGILVWEDGAFMELDNAVLPWANLNCSLLEASKLFKSFASTDTGRLIDVANRFHYAGFGNVRFRFIQGDEHVDVTMNLTPVEINSVITTPAADEYSVNVTEEGNLYIRNQVTTPDPDNIISNESKSVNLSPGDNVFDLS